MTDTTWRRVTGWAALLVAILALFFLVDKLDWLIAPILSVLPPFAIAFVLAFLLNPLIVRLEKRGMSRGLAVPLVSLSFLLIFVALAFFVVPRIADQAVGLAKNVPAYGQEAGQVLDKLLVRERSLLHRFNLPTTVSGLASRFSTEIRGASASALTAVSSFILAIFSKALWLVLIPLLTIYLLGNWSHVGSSVLRLVPESHRPQVLRLSKSIATVFSAYIRGQVVLALLYGAASALVLAAFGVDYWLILGLVATLAAPIPYIGSAIILISSGIVAYAQNPSLTHVLLILGSLAFINNIIFDNLLTPKILGKSVGLNLFWSVFALMLGGAMFGFIGVILAYPVGAMIKVVLYDLFPQLGGPEDGRGGEGRGTPGARRFRRRRGA